MVRGYAYGGDAEQRPHRMNNRLPSGSADPRCQNAANSQVLMSMLAGDVFGHICGVLAHAKE